MNKYKVKFSFHMESLLIGSNQVCVGHPDRRLVQNRTIEIVLMAKSHQDAIDLVHSTFTEIIADRLRADFPSTTIVKEHV